MLKIIRSVKKLNNVHILAALILQIMGIKEKKMLKPCKDFSICSLFLYLSLYIDIILYTL